MPQKRSKNKKKSTHSQKEETGLDPGNEQLLTDFSISKEKFIQCYVEHFYGTPKARNFFLQIVAQMEEAILDNNTLVFKDLSSVIECVFNLGITVNEYVNDSKSRAIVSNFVILACRFSRLEILKHFSTVCYHFLTGLPAAEAPASYLMHTDEEKHNACYYAIRSSNLNILKTLTEQWKGLPLAVGSVKLDEILSQAYQELKLRNVKISHEMDFYLAEKFIDSHFTPSSSQVKRAVIDQSPPFLRIALVLDKINFLNVEYSKSEVDDKFLYVAKFIVRNIHLLKRQLKSTYDRLPWEEIEFCLISFTLSQSKRQKMNFLYNITLTKKRIIEHMTNFAAELLTVKNEIEQIHACPLATTRSHNIEKIERNNPEFTKLYNDHEQIRDVHSLEKMRKFLLFLVEANPQRKEGQLTILRVLQIIGEYLKNTNESPKLSDTTSNLLSLSLPQNMKKIIIKLRDNFSHAFCLSEKIHIEENADVDFFIGLQNDAKTIGSVVADVLRFKLVKGVKQLLKKVVSAESLNELQTIARTFDNLEVIKVLPETFNSALHEKLGNTVKEVNSAITGQTDFEKDQFVKIEKLFSQTRDVNNNYATGLASAQRLFWLLNDEKAYSEQEGKIFLKVLKHQAEISLKSITPKLKSCSLKEIVEILTKILSSVKARMPKDNFDKLQMLWYRCKLITDVESTDVKWIETLGETIKGNISLPPHMKEENTGETVGRPNDTLILKLNQLQNILDKEGFSSGTSEKLACYTKGAEFQLAVEMLVMDIFSILERQGRIENNMFSLDDYMPALTGKCLRDHLAHDNLILELLLSDPSLAVIINARKFVDIKNLAQGTQRIGRVVEENLSSSVTQFDQGLRMMSTQEKMFTALVKGNMQWLKTSLQEGADINARSSNSSTVIHFASRSADLDILRFVLSQNPNLTVKDDDGQTPLHVAAKHGQQKTVEFLLKETDLKVCDTNNFGETPLHLAARNGHTVAVEVLLKNKASASPKCRNGFSPLHCAVAQNYIKVVKTLLELENHADDNRTRSGCTSLHLAAELGHLDVVGVLIARKAFVNATNNDNETPLHLAAFSGHMEVVESLLNNGANVNMRTSDGRTPLHLAVQNGYEQIARALLQHGASPDLIDKLYGYAPLHYASFNGHLGIVKALLENEANPNLRNLESDSTPLHLAAYGGHLQIVKILLDHNVNIHVKDDKSQTPVLYAVINGQKEITELLLNRGCDVNAKTPDGETLLHVAVSYGHVDVVKLLLQFNASVNAKNKLENRPLHYAASSGRTDIIDILLKNKAKVNVVNLRGITPIHSAAFGSTDALALLIKNNGDVNIRSKCGASPLEGAIVSKNLANVQILVKRKVPVNFIGVSKETMLSLAINTGCMEIVEYLLSKNAKVNAKSNNLSPLTLAVGRNFMEIVKVLLANGADVNEDGGKPLRCAVLRSHRSVIEILLNNGASVNKTYEHGMSILHFAAIRGDGLIANDLIRKGVAVDARCVENKTPLFRAAWDGHEEVVKALIANKADVNAVNFQGTPLHAAIYNGHIRIVDILIKSGASMNLRDENDRTPAGLAMAQHNLPITQMLFRQDKENLNTKYSDGWTWLHIAARNLEIVKFLVEEGADVHARDEMGCKPIHTAARKCKKDVVEFFLSKGLSINEADAYGQSVLHHAIMEGNAEFVDYVIACNADVNLKNKNGTSPLHIAAHTGFKRAVESLLKNGAFYNAVEELGRKPIDMAQEAGVLALLQSTDKLYKAVKSNNLEQVALSIKAGAFVDAKHPNYGTPLHYAVWKGHIDIIHCLLENSANPNISIRKGATPLHYATKYSQPKAVKALLYHGAKYNCVSDEGKTPMDLSEDKEIRFLLKTLDDAFRYVKSGNYKVIGLLKKLEAEETTKAVMRASNEDGYTLIVAAVNWKCPEVYQLKELFQGKTSIRTTGILYQNWQISYHECLRTLKSLHLRMTDVLGHNNPVTLDVLVAIAGLHEEEGNHGEALDIFDSVCQKQKLSGLNYEETLYVQSKLAHLLRQSHKYEEALSIYQEVYNKQKDQLGPNHSDTLVTHLHLASVLGKLGKHEDSVRINKFVFEMQKKTLGEDHPETLFAQFNLAEAYVIQNKFEEAREIFQDNWMRKRKVFGEHDRDTVKTLCNIASMLLGQGKTNEALSTARKVINTEKMVLRPYQPYILSAHNTIATCLFDQGNFESALNAFKEMTIQVKETYGPSHPFLQKFSTRIEQINSILKCKGDDLLEALDQWQKDKNAPPEVW